MARRGESTTLSPGKLAWLWVKRLLLAYGFFSLGYLIVVTWLLHDTERLLKGLQAEVKLKQATLIQLRAMASGELSRLVWEETVKPDGKTYVKVKCRPIGFDGYVVSLGILCESSKPCEAGDLDAYSKWD